MNDNNQAQVLELLMVVFKDNKSADQALKEVKQAQSDGDIEIIDAIVVRKNEKGRISHKELADVRFRNKGRLIGGTAGAVVGLLGPAGFLAATAVGAVGGGLISRLKDKGVPTQDVKTMAEALDNNSSALVALIDHVWVQKLIDQVAEETAQVVRQELNSEAHAVILTAAEEI